MLKKIMTYDIKAMARFSMPMFIASGVVAVVCCAVLYFTLSFSESSDFVIALMMVTGFYGIGILALFAMCVINSFMTVYRYYKSVFTDEGYLTMVIPAKTSTVVNAKILSTLLWTAISSLVFLASTFVAVVIPIALSNVGAISGVVEFFESAGLDEMFAVESLAVMVTTLIYYAVAFVEHTVIVITAITVGAVVMSRYKIFGAICIYLAIDFVHEIVVTVSSVVFFFPNEYYILELIVSNILKIVLAIGFGVVMYLLDLHVMSKKFNI